MSTRNGTLLREMEDVQYTGMIFIGVAGPALTEWIAELERKIGQLTTYPAVGLYEGPRITKLAPDSFASVTPRLRRVRTFRGNCNMSPAATC